MRSGETCAMAWVLAENATLSYSTHVLLNASKRCPIPIMLMCITPTQQSCTREKEYQAVCNSLKQPPGKLDQIPDGI